jgi:DNA invertase Pin-like site-specific DNA recombinase
MERLGEAGAGFRSLTEAIDTTTPAGRMMMQMVGVFAEFKRAMLKEQTKAGLDAARKKGRIGGRRPKLTPQQQVEIRKMVSRGDKTAADAARLFKDPSGHRQQASCPDAAVNEEGQACQIMLTVLRQISLK